MIHLRAAQPDDAHAARRLLLDTTIPRRLHRYTAYGQDDGTALLRNAIAKGDRMRYVLAQDRRRSIAGYLEYHFADDGFLFVDYVCISPELQGSGYGRRLFDHLAVQHPNRSIALDVFDENSDAQRFYRRLGFVEVSRSYWWRWTLAGLATNSTQMPPHTLNARPLDSVSGIRNALLTVDGKAVRVSILGGRIARFFDADTVNSRDILVQLQGQFPGVREGLLLSPQSVAPSVGASKIATSLRLQSAQN